MIEKTSAYHCRVCESANIVRNGANRLGQQQYHCKDCGVYRVLESRREAKKQKPLILRAYQERISLRGLRRLFGIHRLTIARWIREHVAAWPTLIATLLPAQPDDVLECSVPPRILQSSKKAVSLVHQKERHSPRQGRLAGLEPATF